MSVVVKFVKKDNENKRGNVIDNFKNGQPILVDEMARTDIENLAKSIGVDMKPFGDTINFTIEWVEGGNPFEKIDGYGMLLRKIFYEAA